MATLSERDRNLIANKIEDLNSQNEQIQDGIVRDTIEVNELTLLDIPNKKQLDEKHYNIYAYEEELRLLSGQTIIQPVEEDSFWITSPESDTYIIINDGRFIAKKDTIEIINVPIIPTRGHILSNIAGTDFEIWTRDRRGSATSNLNVPSTYTINRGNNKIKVKIDGVEREIDIFDEVTLQAVNDEMTIEASVLGSQITAVLQAINHPSFTEATMMYNSSRQTFTLTSGTGGTNSTAEVIVESTNDLAYVMKFDVQAKITGRYANNKLKVEIDSEVYEIELLADIRRATEDVNLGLNLDDFGIDWREEFIIGPMFPAPNNNGSDIAKAIENALRNVGIGGFENAKVYYWPDSQKFIMYSGTFGSTSSINVLPHPDSNRDLRITLGFDGYSEKRGNEISYDTIGSLYNFLNSSTSLIATNLINSSKKSYSLLSLVDGVPISDQNFIAQTTTEYDNAHFSLPRIYLNGNIVIDASNNSINFTEGTGEITKFVPDGTYTSSVLAEKVQEQLNDGTSLTYTCTYDTITRKFIITASSTMKFLFNSGNNKDTSALTAMGYQNIIDQTGVTFYSNGIQYTTSDYFEMYRFSQLIDGTPWYIDDDFGEEYWLPIEKNLLFAEFNYALNDLKNQTTFSNEVHLNHWEAIRAIESNVISIQYEALRQEIGLYSRISTTDATYNNKVNALNSLTANINNLAQFSDYRSIMNFRADTKSFTYNTDFTEGGIEQLSILIANPNDDRIYDRPSPEFRYADNKYVPIIYNSLYNSSVNFDLAQQTAFRIRSNKTDTSGYATSGADADDLFLINRSSDSSAITTSSNSEPFDLSSANTINVAIDGGALQSYTINSSSAYIESTSVLSNDSLTITASNDALVVKDAFAVQFTVNITAGVYTAAALATALQTALQTASPATGFTVSTASSQFTLASALPVDYLFASGSTISEMIGFSADVLATTSTTGLTRNIYVQSGINDEFSIQVNGTNSNTLTVSNGNYTISSLASSLQTLINNDPPLLNDQVTVANIGSKIRITTDKKGTSATIAVAVGIDDFLRSIYLNTAVPVNGSGDVSDIENVTASEIASIITANITGASASDNAGNVEVITDSSLGKLSKIHFSANSFTTALGFSTSPIIGQNQNNKLNVEIDGVEQIILLTTNPSQISGTTVAADIKGKLQAIGIGGFTNADCQYNYADFPHQFRIYSGTNGIFSSAFVLDKTIEITVSNNKIDFEETNGVQLTATLTNNSYTAASLAAEIQTQLNAAGASAYTVSFISNKMNIISNGFGGGGVFNLIFASGTNSANSVASDIGFYKVDKTGSLTYQSDAEVNTRSAIEELNYTVQVNEPGHIISDTQLTITNTEITSRIFWLDNGGGNKIDWEYDFATYPTIKSIFDIISLNHTDYDIGYLPDLYSRHKQTFYPIINNDELNITSSAGLETYTFSATAGTSISAVDPATKVSTGDTLFISINNEASQAIFLDSANSTDSVAAEIQRKVRTLNSAILGNKPAYTNFLCTYSSGQYILVSGTQGTSSKVVITGGSVAPALKLGLANGGTETAGSGDCLNNYFVSIAEIVASSSFTPSLLNSSGFLKIQEVTPSATNTLSISGNMAEKLGFYTDNLVNDPVTELGTVSSISFKNISAQSITLNYDVLRGYENRGNITATYYITDDSLIDSRISAATTRWSGISTRLTQISARKSAINAALTPTLYDDRWDDIVIRLNKNNGTYFKVGEKEQAIQRQEDLINDNNDQINQLQTLLDS